MAKTRVRRIIRKRKLAHAEPFDEQLWPIQLTLVLLGGFLIGLVLAYLRFNDLREPEAVPRGTDFASVIESDVPVVVQHTRLDSREAALALLSTTAYPD